MQIAIVFECVGALVLGRTVTSTIQGGIADASVFAREPQVGCVGELCVCVCVCACVCVCV